MQATIINIYSNESPDNSNLRGAHVQSFWISIDNEKILFDTGGNLDVLLHNMNELEIFPNDVNKITGIMTNIYG
ncbi:hypothetical protein [Candidatus Hodarchaeum mangrovi]